jgi:hypothetical protein
VLSAFVRQASHCSKPPASGAECTAARGCARHPDTLTPQSRSDMCTGFLVSSSSPAILYIHLALIFISIWNMAGAIQFGISAWRRSESLVMLARHRLACCTDDRGACFGAAALCPVLRRGSGSALRCSVPRVVSVRPHATVTARACVAVWAVCAPSACRGTDGSRHATLGRACTARPRSPLACEEFLYERDDVKSSLASPA